MIDEEDDGLTPYEKLERARYGEESSLPEAGERLLTFWHHLMTGTFTGHALGASPTTVARVLKILSDADLLLTRLIGCGAVRTGLWFDPEFAAERADKLEETGEADGPAETLRRVAAAWQDTPELAHVPPITPHFLMAAMLYWSQGNEFAWPLYQKMLPRIVNVTAAELFRRLHLLGAPAGMAQVEPIGRPVDLPVKVIAPVFVRFEDRYQPGKKTKDFGPFFWVQMVHDELKVAPSGRHLATLHQNGGAAVWEVADPSVPPETYFTDMIIGPAEVPDGWSQPEDEPGPAGPGVPGEGPAG